MGENKVTKKSTDFLFVGLALFAMFFGAGNLIFPPELGVKTGFDWFSSFMGFFIADAGLAVLGVFCIMRFHGKYRGMTAPIGKTLGSILILAIVICIGPGLAIPRTATVTFSLGVVPVFGIDPANTMALAIFSVIYFIIVFFLAVRPSAVVDIVGKVLTPALVVILLVLIAVGIMNPGGEVQAGLIDGAIKEGIASGYQTMDAMASVLFAGIIIASIYEKGYAKGKESNTQTGKAAIVALILLFIVYGGLAYLGATTGTIWKADVASQNIDQAGLVINIVNHLLGRVGVILIGICVLLACLTTAIGLTSAAGDIFSKFTHNKISYEKFVAVICIFSAFVSNLGLAQIISIAAPILTLVYPALIYLMIAAFFYNMFPRVWAYRLGALAAFVISALTVLNGAPFNVEALGWVHSLPLASFGLNWVVPALVGTIIGAFIPGTLSDFNSSPEALED
ncbi:branched-chain amino acid transport system II carrier protein [Peptoniphilus sp. KCTC 25270]|uniref:branched-chain amino acid transport system II carrier protein n=1 Tax=Peptoniphilus sp. KCTC 25270 TaxID=2897414 RepID=UPI001E5B0674|nr:branched-chain amino acid transport system II carrier protein [Peptoniphilus sp. KCTC 25270]MCD1147731.1 branched-chain amino acid transport system II carrier protein [Peptoniphilus sp. KCTC 25270]